MEPADLTKSLARSGERVVELQTALTACKALGPDNGGHGEIEKILYITRQLEACGVTDLTRVDAPDARVPCGLRPNLIARIPGQSTRTLWLFGHTDVVPAGDISAWTSDPWQVRKKGDWLYGRGVEDNQQAIVSMLLLAEALQDRRITPALSLGLVFMADEETGSRYGLEHVLDAAAPFFMPDDLFIVPDAGSSRGDMIEVAEKGQLWLKVSTRGKQCHASTPHKGRNAFLAGADMALSCHTGLAAAFPQQDPLFRLPTSTFVPSKHEANADAINIVPGDDLFYLDCRLVPGVSHDAVLAETQRIADVVAARHGVRITVGVEHSQQGSYTPPQSPVVRALQEAIRPVYNVEAQPVGIGGVTVATYLRQKGLPAAVWACLENSCHQADERASISAACKDAQVFASILMRGECYA